MAETSDVLRGHIDMIVLARLAQGDCYGYRINRDIQSKTGEKYELKEATLYSAFRRLEKEGYISSYWGDEDSGARRRYYGITDKGKQAYDGLRAEWRDVKKVIDALVGESEKKAPAKAAAPAAAKTKKSAVKTTTKAKAAPKTKEGKK